jgi:hypothetical protein
MTKGCLGNINDAQPTRGYDVPADNYVGIAVPFTEEEIENLAHVAAAEGASIVELIRARVFGPRIDALEAYDGDDEDLMTLIARLEGIRIRGRRRGGQD